MCMNVQFVNNNSGTAIIIQEECIDIQNATILRELLLDLICKGQNRLLLDLKKVKFIDSSGLGALVYCLREARKSKGTVQVSGLSEHVASMFTITRLNKIFEII